jgi:hypothetical protein
MERWYEIKIRAVMGPGPQDDKKVTILNRTIWWEVDKITYEGDDKNVKRVIEEMGLQGDSKGVDVPVGKESEDGEESVALGTSEAARFRRIAATINYIALDRPDLQFTASVLGRSMSKPTEKSWMALKRAARYLVKHPRMQYVYHRTTVEEVQEMVGYSDSDWAGCKGTRRSMSGGVVTLGGGTLKSWSNRQGSVALSSGEAEYYAIVKLVAELMGIKALASDLGWEVTLRAFVDSSAAKAIASRVGLGKVRHLEVRFLWLQEAVRRKLVQVRKIPGIWNPADVATKSKTFDESKRLLARVAVVPPVVDLAV